MTANNTFHGDEIAIIGMSGRFPGARSISEYWSNLKNERESIRSLGRAELIKNGVPETLIDDSRYVKRGAFLSEVEWFDAQFFGFSAKEAEIMDPQHRLFLECCWEALEEAGYVNQTEDHLIGVFGSAALNPGFLLHLHSNERAIKALGSNRVLLSNDKDFLTTWVSYKLGLTGPSVAVQTACSSSLVAVHLACQSLLNGESEIALAGGVSILLPQETGYYSENGGIVSHDGYCRAFGAMANGTVFGSGVGVVALKRLADAMRDGDTPHAVIKGSAINNDGRSKVGYTAPSVSGQSKVISDALLVAQVAAESIMLMEGHGTGTYLGDPVEVRALTEAFSKSTDKKGFCGIGSVKSSIGHLNNASGIAGLIKVVLALKNKWMPASLHCSDTNPEIDFDHSPFYTLSSGRPWETAGKTRRAGISSFGIGGTNAHVIVEEAPSVVRTIIPRTCYLLPLSARTPEALQQLVDKFVQFLLNSPDQDLGAVAFTLQTGRKLFSNRRVVICNDFEDAIYQLKGDPPPQLQSICLRELELVFALRCNGSNMLETLYDTYRTQRLFDESVCQLLNLLPAEHKRCIEEVLQVERNKSSDFSQRFGRLTKECARALSFILQFAAIHFWKGWGVNPESFIASDTGELAAACHSELLSVESALGVIWGRAVSEVERSPTVSIFSEVSNRWLRPGQNVQFSYWLDYPWTDASSSRNAEALNYGNTFVLDVSLPGDSHKATNHSSQLKRNSAENGYRKLIAAIGQLWLSGCPVSFEKIWETGERRKIHLPTYPFQRERYWIEFDKNKNQDSPLDSSSVQSMKMEEVPVEKNYTIESDDDSEVPSKLGFIIEKLKKISVDLVGGTAEEINSDVYFYDAGVDSLLLVRLSEQIRAVFHLEIPFRRLFEDLCTLNELAKYINGHSHPEPKGNKTNKSDAVAPTDRHEVLKVNSVDESDNEPDVSFSAKSRITGTNELKNSGNQTGSMELQTGRYSQINRNRHQHFTSSQREYISHLITDYCSKTNKSKILTQQNRSKLADPRTVAGFRLSWKEMVYPIFVAKSKGSRLWDVDGNEYLDFTMGFGANLFGHSPEFINTRIAKTLNDGFAIGPQSPLVSEITSTICDMTGMERLTYCNTGSEAVIAAIRVARAVTARQLIVMFGGSYHGIFDYVLAKQNTVLGDFSGVPIAPGIPPSVLKEVLVLEYGPAESLRIIQSRISEIAAVLVEPVQSRRPEFQPKTFLEELRVITKHGGAVLIMDEVITGFRVHQGGAQAWFGVQGDLATYGKVLGGGMPIGVLAGKGRYMDALDGGYWSYGDSSMPPSNVTFFAGTFIRHPLALSASAGVLEHLKEAGPGLHEQLNARTTHLVKSLNHIFKEEKAPASVASFGSLFQFRFSGGGDLSALFYFRLRASGIHVWEGRPCFLSTAHTDDDCEYFLEQVRNAIQGLRWGGFYESSAATQTEPDVSALTHQTTSKKTLDQTTNLKVSSPVGTDPVLKTTESQRQIWFQCMTSDSASCAYNESIILRISGFLHIPHMEGALKDVVSRHESLRSKFSFDGEEQAITQEELNPVLVDLSYLNSGKQDEALEQCISAIINRVFRLNQAPLVRATILRLTDQSHVIVLVIHHIVICGSAYSIVLRDLIEFYVAKCRNYSIVPSIAIPLRHVSISNNKEIKSADDEFWRAQFADGFPEINLPTDSPRPRLLKYEGNYRFRVFERELSDAVVQLSRQNGCTLFVALLGLFKILLHRITGQRKLIVGIPRDTAAVDRPVDQTVVLLPIVSDISSELTVRQFIDHLKKNVLEAVTHSDFCLSRLVANGKIAWNPSMRRIMEITFNLDSCHSRTIELGEAQATISSGYARGAKSDLCVNMVHENGKFQIECGYSTELFRASTIDSWLSYFEQIVREATSNPNQKVSEIQMGDFVGIPALSVSSKMPGNDLSLIYRHFEAWARKRPQETAVVCNEVRISYETLNQKSNRLARFLQKAGVHSEVLVGLMFERSIEMIISILAIWKAGGAYLPIEESCPKERVFTILQDSSVGIILSEEKFAEQFADYPILPFYWEQLQNQLELLSGENLSVEVCENNLAYVIYTSGSTGQPKGALVTHRNVAALFKSANEHFAFDSTEVWTMFHSFAFDFSVWEIWGALAHGARLIIVPFKVSRSPESFCRLLLKNEVTVLSQTPSAFKLILSSGEIVNELRVPSLKWIIFGGEALDFSCLEKWFQVYGDEKPRLVNMYGITETTVHVTLREISKGDIGKGSRIGRPLTHLSFQILDSYLNPLPPRVVGEFFIGGDGVARGYLNRPDLTAERFVPDPFSNKPGERLYRTGDRGKWLSSDDVIYDGRKDRQVKIRGFRIELGEVERAICKYSGVKETLVLAQNDGELSKLIAYVRMECAEPIQLLRKHLKQILPEYMLPAAIVQLSEFPLTTNGKIDYRQLPNASSENNSDLSSHRVITPCEEIVAGIWKEVLKREQISIFENFFQIGGDSLSAIQVIVRLRAAIHPDIGVEMLFESPTILDLSARAQDLLSSVTPGSFHLSQAQRPNEIPLSFAQQQLWLQDQIEPGNSAYIIFNAFRMRGKLNKEAFCKAVSEVQRRHEVLRTRFDSRPDGPVQIIDTNVNTNIHLVSLKDLPQDRKLLESKQLAEMESRRPFNLSEGPLIRLMIVQLDEHEHVVFCAMHHIVSDIWSMGLLIWEVGTLYNAFRLGNPCPIQELTAQYSDYAIWQRKFLQGPRFEAQLKYWRDQLLDVPPLLDLTGYRVRPQKPSNAGALLEFSIPSEVLGRLKRLSQREGATLYMTLLAAFKVLIFRYTGREDLVVGTPFANRQLKEIEPLIGFFVNMLVLRSNLSGDPTFLDVLKRVSRTALKAYFHAEVPFDRLIEELCVERNSSYAPIIQIVFSFYTAPRKTTEFGELECESMALVKPTSAKYDLTFMLSDNGDHLDGAVEYRTDLFNSSDLQKLTSDYAVILNQISLCPESRILDYSISESDTGLTGKQEEASEGQETFYF